jgi:pilus assembly protein CpaB
MKSKTMILMVVAVVCGLAASYMTSRLLAERNTEKFVEEEKIKILVARQNLTQGTFVKEPEKMFEEKDFTKGEEPKKAAKSFDEVRNKRLAKGLSAEQWVSVDDLLSKDQSDFQVPKGMRAMAIKVNVDTIVAGFVLPNSRVDVLNTVPGEKEAYTQTILQNMLVLSVDQQNVRDQEKKTILGNTVTLAVTPEEAQTLSLAQKMGELRLVLRPFEDTDIVKLSSTRPDDVRRRKQIAAGHGGAEEVQDGPKNPLLKVPDVSVGPSSPVAETPRPEPEPRKPQRHTLVIINGESTTKAIYPLGDEDGDAPTQIQRSDPEPRPEKPKPSKSTPAPDKGAPAPSKGQTSTPKG